MSHRIVPFRRVQGVPSELSDEALLVACATGESAALGALFDRHYESVRRFLARVSGTDDRDLDDLVQETFAALPRAARSFHGQSQVKTWLFGVAANVARHHVRGEIRRRALRQNYASNLYTDSVDGQEEFLERERATRLQNAVLNLPHHLREPFVMVYLEGLPGAEAARSLNTREGTIWKRLHQARERLAESLRQSDVPQVVTKEAASAGKSGQGTTT